MDPSVDIGSAVVVALLLALFSWRKWTRVGTAILFATFIRLVGLSKQMTELINLIPNTRIVGEFSTSGAVLGLLTGAVALWLYKKTSSRYLFIVALTMTLNLLNIDIILVKSIPTIRDFVVEAGPWIVSQIGNFFDWVTSQIK